jgi:sugar phosphate isomerase/epimerase
MLSVNRRDFLLVAGAAAGRAGLAQSSADQTFVAGLVPGGRGPGPRSAAPQAARPAGPPAMSADARRESFWKACDDCNALGVHNVEVNNTFSQLAQSYDARISEFKEEMSKRNLQLVNLAMYAHLHLTAERQAMIDEHLRAARFLKAVGGRYIVQLIAPAANLGNGDEESYRRVDPKPVIANCNEIGKRVQEETGIRIGYHPEQGDIRTGLWKQMVDGTDPRYYHFWPDVGHLQVCGVDPMKTYKDYRSRMVGSHLRDCAAPTQTAGEQAPARGRMVPFGEGIVPLPALIAFLRQTKFTGAVMGEGGGNKLMRDYMVETLHLTL